MKESNQPGNDKALAIYQPLNIALPRLKISRPAFTLAELLIALAILGVIAVFTIPKVLQSQADSKYSSMAKEAAGTMTAALDATRLNNGLTGGTASKDMAQYLNYVRVDTLTTGAIQDNWGTTYNCQSTAPCYILHNGGYLWLTPSTFGGTGSTNATDFIFDPDGPGPQKAVWFYLYYNNRIVTIGTCFANTMKGGGATGCPYAGGDPAWFNWN